MKALDLTGKTFGRLTAIKLAPRKVGSNSKRYWHCKCTCGAIVEVCTNALNRGHTKSCGCFRSDFFAAKMHKHGGIKSPEYKSWANAINRCENPADKRFHSYGGRGISVCPEWRNSFEQFLSDMGERPSPDYTLDRIDNDGNYEAKNCRWASRTTQMRNTRANRLVTYMGERICIAEASDRTGLNYNTIYSRLSNGWSDYDALHTPLRQKRAQPASEHSGEAA